jgi:hypothetical protein
MAHPQCRTVQRGARDRLRVATSRGARCLSRRSDQHRDSHQKNESPAHNRSVALQCPIHIRCNHRCASAASRIPRSGTASVPGLQRVTPQDKMDDCVDTRPQRQRVPPSSNAGSRARRSETACPPAPAAGARPQTQPAAPSFSDLAMHSLCLPFRGQEAVRGGLVGCRWRWRPDLVGLDEVPVSRPANRQWHSHDSC